jgi:hypothetical protein
MYNEDEVKTPCVDRQPVGWIASVFTLGFLVSYDFCKAQGRSQSCLIIKALCLARVWIDVLQRPMCGLVTSVALLVGDGAFRRWGLVGGSEVTGGVALEGTWGPQPLPLSLSCTSGCQE